MTTHLQTHAIPVGVVREPPLQGQGVGDANRWGGWSGRSKRCLTKRINVLRDTPGGRFWQRNYWERIIRDETSYQRIYRYVQHNPASWEDDQLHPDAPPNPFNRG